MQCSKWFSVMLMLVMMFGEEIKCVYDCIWDWIMFSGVEWLNVCIGFQVFRQLIFEQCQVCWEVYKVFFVEECWVFVEKVMVCCQVLVEVFV